MCSKVLGTCHLSLEGKYMVSNSLCSFCTVPTPRQHNLPKEGCYCGRKPSLERLVGSSQKLFAIQSEETHLLHGVCGSVEMQFRGSRKGWGHSLSPLSPIPGTLVSDSPTDPVSGRMWSQALHLAKPLDDACRKIRSNISAGPLEGSLSHYISSASEMYRLCLYEN